METNVTKKHKRGSDFHLLKRLTSPDLVYGLWTRTSSLIWHGENLIALITDYSRFFFLVEWTWAGAIYRTVVVAAVRVRFSALIRLTVTLLTPWWMKATQSPDTGAGLLHMLNLQFQLIHHTV